MKPRRIPAFNLEAEIHKDAGIDSEPLRFGKYPGKTPDEIADEDPSYIIWMFESIKNPPCSKFLYECCKWDSEDSPDLRDMDDFFGSFQ